MVDEASSPINQRIAARVKSLRMDRGWTIEALAAKSGVSRSMISLLERSESSPTAVVLDRLAIGLGVPLASLFDEAPAAPSPMRRRAEQTPWRDPESGYVRRNVSPPGFDTPFRIVDVELPAGAHVAYDTATQRLDQQVWVLEGAIELKLGDARHRLEAGDCLAMRLDAPTAFRNPTRKRARYAVVIASDARPFTRRTD